MLLIIICSLIEEILSNSMMNNKKVEPEEISKEDKEWKREIRRITNILQNRNRCTEDGCCVQISAEELL